MVCESWELNHSPLRSMQQMPITTGSHSDQEKWKFEVTLKGDKLVMPISLCMARERTHSTTEWMNNRYYPVGGCEVHLKVHSPLHSLTCRLPWDAIKTKQFWVSLRVCTNCSDKTRAVSHVPRWRLPLSSFCFQEGFHFLCALSKDKTVAINKFKCLFFLIFLAIFQRHVCFL